MKKLIYVAALILAVGLTQSFADTGTISQKVAASFRHDFESAKNVSWQAAPNYIKATFSLGGHILFAYYSQEGDLIAVVRNILSDHLPILLHTELRKEYKEFWVTDLFEMASEDQTTYWCSIESPDMTLILHSDGNDHWSVYKRIKKLSI
jgi:hypothetical protein